MRSQIRVVSAVLSALLVAPHAGLAEPMQVTSERIPGVPKGGNARITASVPPQTSVSAARVYFNAEGKTPEYYLEMVRGDAGSFWAVLPIPKSETKKVQYRILFRDAEGKDTWLPRETVPVDDTKFDLTDTEIRYAKNLVIGVTDPDVELLPDGWECYGVVSSINVVGELKPNEVCRSVIIPPALWVAGGTALTAVGAVILTDDDEPKKPVSPSRPGPR